VKIEGKLMSREVLTIAGPTQAETYRLVLEELGFQVHIVTQGKVGLEYAFNHHPDLILLDLNLPHMDPIQVCRHLNRRPEINNIPVIMLTHRDKAIYAIWGLKAGTVDYIAKSEFARYVLVASLTQLGLIE
jgi:DNA-binding response OmpR family regulator